MAIQLLSLRWRALSQGFSGGAWLFDEVICLFWVRNAVPGIANLVDFGAIGVA